jgi:hypothetical protein
MPTKHPRIPVTRDPALGEALTAVAPYFPGRKTATVVHDLALKGAQAVLEQEQVRREALQRLAEWSTKMDDSQRAILEHIDELAWGE